MTQTELDIQNNNIELTNPEIIGPSRHVLDAMRFLGEQYQPENSSETSTKRLERSMSVKRSIFIDYALEASGSYTTLSEMNRYYESGEALSNGAGEIAGMCARVVEHGVEPTFYQNVRSELFDYFSQLGSDKVRNREIIYKMRHFSRLVKPWEPDEPLEPSIEINDIEEIKARSEAETKHSFRSATNTGTLQNLETMANILVMNNYIERGVRIKPENESFFKAVVNGIAGETQNSEILDEEVRKRAIKKTEGMFDLLSSKLEFALALYAQQEDLGYGLEISEESISQIKDVRSVVFGYRRMIAISYAADLIDAINTHNDQESLDLLSKIENSTFAYGVTVNSIAQLQGEKLERFVKKKDEYEKALDLTEELIRLIPEFKPTKKELKERLDDDLMSELLAIEHVHRNGALTEEQLIELKNSPEIQNEVARLKELDENSKLNFGLELEVDDDLDRTSVVSLKKSIMYKYLGVKDQRKAMHYLQTLGVPIDEDCLGEVSLPYSKGYHRQLRAMRILKETGVIPESVTVHVNLSGIKNPAERIDDIIVGTLGLISTNKFGTLDISDGDGFAIGFPEHSQKPLVPDPDAEVRGEVNFPHGLPVLIEGDRIELRGIAEGEMTLGMLEEGMSDIERVFTEIADDSHERENNWDKMRRDLVEVISPVAFPESDPSFVELFTAEYFERAVQLGIISRGSLPVERYITALRVHTHVNSTVFKSELSQTDVMDTALSDPGFINHLLNYEGKIPEEAEILDHINRYYAENRSFDVDGRTYRTKTWEFMRGRVSYAAAANPEFSGRILSIINQ